MSTIAIQLATTSPRMQMVGIRVTKMRAGYLATELVTFSACLLGPMRKKDPTRFVRGTRM